jgi:DNA-binding GntR family transcriptional regulator
MSRASDRAYDRIRDMILQGDLPPGTQIREEQLAETCGVSRTPIRDALRRLEGQAFIRRSESQRSFVAEWSLDDIADAFELRAILEARAAHRAAERMDQAAMQQLRDCNRMIFKAVSQVPADIPAFLAANREFHAIILEKAASRRLSSLLSALIEQPVVWRTAHHYGREALLRSHGEHEELLAAFARRDGGWAEAVMSAHIHRAFHAYADAHQGLSAIDSAIGI